MGWNGSTENKNSKSKPTNKGPRGAAIKKNGSKNSKGNTPAGNQPAGIAAGGVIASTNQQDAVMKKDQTKKLKEPNKKDAKKETASKVMAQSSKTKKVDVETLTADEFKQLIGALFIKSMNYNLQLSGDYEDTLEQRVARVLTNDLGETIRTEVSFALIQEFKKFMFLIAVDILEKKRSNELYSEIYYIDEFKKRMCFSSQYHPHYTIDLVWRFVIQEGQIYSDFCDAISGGYIDRINPVDNMKETLLKYKSARAKVEEYKILLRPYWGIWPEINTTTQLRIDYDHSKAIYNVTKSEIFEDVSSFIKENNFTEVNEANIKQIIEHWVEINPGDVPDNSETPLDREFDFSKVSKRKTGDILSVYDKLMEFEFSDNLRKPLTSMFEFRESSVDIVLTEYKKFLFIYYLTGCECAPNFEIDFFWDLHYSNTKDYREFCKKIFGEFLFSRNYDFNIKGTKSRLKEYKKTLKIYQQLFGEIEEDKFWDSPAYLVVKSNLGIQHINSYKFIWMIVFSNKYSGLEYDHDGEKDEHYTNASKEDIQQTHERNKQKFSGAKEIDQFNKLAAHWTAEDSASFDENKEYELAEQLADSANDSVKNDKSKPNNKGNQPKGQWANREVLDPVITKGGFKYLPAYYDFSIFENEDLMDRMKNLLYEDYPLETGIATRDIFNMAILSRADVDLIDFDTTKDKSKLGIDKSILALKKEDIDFELTVPVRTGNPTPKDKLDKRKAELEASHDSAVSNKSDNTNDSLEDAESNDSNTSNDSSSPVGSDASDSSYESDESGSSSGDNENTSSEINSVESSD